MKKYDVIHIRKVEGQDKPIFTKVGILLEKEDGKMSLKFNHLPVGDWDGWLQVYEQREREESQAPPQEEAVDPF